MANNKLPTQFDVARLSDVSRSTVAAILRSGVDQRYNEETRKRVMEAVKKLNYRPNSSARALRNQRTHSIALVIPTFEVFLGTIKTSILWGAGQRGRQLGYTLTLCGYEEEADIWVTFQKLVREGRFDGVIFYGDPRRPDDERAKALTDMNIPFVILENTASFGPSINFDSYHGSLIATKHLISMGRRKIGFLSYGRIEEECPMAFWTERYRGYSAALAEAGLDLNPALVASQQLNDLDAGLAAIRRVLETGEPFDALVCNTDEMAMSAIQELSRVGKRVPEDVAIVGYDDSPMAPFSSPALTSVRQNGEEMGHLAMSMLDQQIESGTILRQNKTLLPTLTIRHSCGAK